jgi:hypothetical protein
VLQALPSGQPHVQLTELLRQHQLFLLMLRCDCLCCMCCLDICMHSWRAKRPPPFIAFFKSAHAVCWVLLQALPSGQPHAQLTELTGLKGAIGQRCIVMGVISSSEEGGTCIEDEGAVVPLDLSNAKTTGGFITGGWQRMPCNIIW